jgi:hypothetical protein
MQRAANTGLAAAAQGVAAGAGVAAREDRVAGGVTRQVTLTLVNTPVPLVDEAGVVAYGGLKVFDFPAGLLRFEGAIMDLALTLSDVGVDDDWNGDIGLGTATASNNNSLSGTEQDLIPTTATPQATSGATTGDGESTSTEAGVVFDGTGTAKDCYLNILVDDADHDVDGDATDIIVNGTITITYTLLGDN